MTTTAPCIRKRSTPPAPTASRFAGLEQRVFLMATVAVMLHVADDNYFQPEPGVSPGDHLVSGLVPLGLLGLAAAAYFRIRAGARAVLAIVVGLMGVVVGLVEAGYYTVTVGPSGDDYTGFVAGIAGLALVALGFAVLWRSRKPEPSRRRCYVRRAVIGLVGLAVIA